MKPLFDEDQWPRVCQALDGFRELGPILERHGLIAGDGVVDIERVIGPVNRQVIELQAVAPAKGDRVDVRVARVVRPVAVVAQPNKVAIRKELTVDQKRLLSRHRANLDAAIRWIERQIELQPHQRDALFELLFRESDVPKLIGDYDDLVVQFELTRLSEAKLKPLFDDDQWPKVLREIERAQLVKPLLVQKGLLNDGVHVELNIKERK